MDTMKDSNYMSDAPPPPYPGVGPSGYPGYPTYPPQNPSNQPPIGFSEPITSPSQPVVITTTGAPVVVLGVAYGEQSMQVQCGYCRATVFTQTKVKPGGLSWLVFALCCLFGCWLGCCLIPFCVDSMQDVEHYCPNCKAKLGTYSRM
ncbi:hypothetical protein CHUAL_005685 [Chamberlinius hualienensis]